MLNNSEELIPTISICIPTFNRCEKIFKLVTDILSYPGEEIQVIVLDNCSTDETKMVLNKITDKRFCFCQNEENIGGVFNILKTLTLGKGKFSILCLDKDDLDQSQIDKIARKFNLDSEVVFGHFTLNIKNESSDIIYDKGYPSVLKMAYSTIHPTGIFYKTDEYKKLTILKDIFDKKKNFPFYTDIINAEMAMMGKSLLINSPIFYTEKKEDAREKPSFTYNENNLYFSPLNRRIQFDTYLEYGENLKLSNYELFKLTIRLYYQGLILSTFGYKYMKGDYDVCAHHCIASDKVSYLDMWKLSLHFCFHFIKKETAINFLQKAVIIFIGNFKFAIKIVLMSFKFLKSLICHNGRK